MRTPGQGRALPEGYFYHGTRPANFAMICASGLEPRPAGSPHAAIFFDRWDQAFATDRVNVLFRVAATSVPDIYPRAGGYIVARAIPPADLEFWGADGRWHRAA